MIEQALRLLHPTGVFEIRIPSVETSNGYAETWYGYFDDHARAAQAVKPFDRPGVPAVYVTLNPVMSDLLARANNRLKRWRKGDPQTHDNEIAFRRWFFVDVDPIRPTGISASEQEHRTAIEMASGVAQWLQGIGFPSPVAADSGNGAHLLYSINVPNDDRSRDMLQKCLHAVRVEFPPEVGVDIDLKVYNAARVIKLYGTTARKGDPLPDRPHRKSRVLKIPDPLVEVLL